ncbi:MAG: ribonuclease P protein component [Dermatophilaceae bacterium]
MLPARHRLRRSADFRAAARGPRSTRAGGPLMVISLRAADPSTVRPTRVGFAVGRPVGGAVVRNRTRRRLRAIVAARLDGIPSGVDVVVRATPAAAGATFAALGAELDRVLDRALRGVR